MICLIGSSYVVNGTQRKPYYLVYIEVDPSTLEPPKHTEGQPSRQAPSNKSSLKNLNAKHNTHFIFIQLSTE